MKRWFIPWLAASICSAISAQPVARDGYRFERSEFVKKNLTIQVVEFSSLKALRASMSPDIPAEARAQTDAYSLYIQEGHKCIIVIVDPRIHYAPEDIGHELMHCVHGDFHPSIEP